ncbi:MAG TPA: MBL fold metallo-hydrolase [Candidatus Nitrosotenuis sp.]|nr:MBL fold metallo-hydrolase [Candidatus Nitrosotenuis sp.]
MASGSAGNSTLLETSSTRLLVDAGLSKRETLRRLNELGTLPDSVDGILITHEHTDHCNGLPGLAAHWRTTVFVTEPTRAEIARVLPDGKGQRLERVENIRAGQRFRIGDIDVSAFAIPHDAVDPLGFAFSANGVRVAVVTDLGYLPELVKHHLRGADLLVLESNHDVEMLKVGPYPWHVKQRVMSRTGHLSNHAVSEFLCDADGFDAAARHLVLAHLSENNNNPDVARLSAEEALARRAGAMYSGQLHIASQHTPLGPFHL